MFDAVPIEERLYTAAQTREIDRCAIDTHGIAGATLMSRAAAVTLEHLLARWPNPEKLHVLCGTGNNGGDGFLIADQACKRGINAVVYTVGEVEKIRGDARIAFDQARSNGVPFEVFGGQLPGPGVVVDAMLGTGLGGDVRPGYAAAIEAVNTAGLPVVAVDVPSGLCADTGAVLGRAVRADVTVTFIALKRGLFTKEAPDYVGDVEFSDLAVPPAAYDGVSSRAHRLNLPALLEALPPRPSTAHKGMYGTVLVIGGDYGMAGAAMLAAEAALRCGAGLVRVATRAEHAAAVVARTPEAMTVAVEGLGTLAPYLESADAVVIGPGLGQSAWAESLLTAVLASDKPLLVDADALNLLAGLGGATRRDNWVLTPHPGEAARLLGQSTAQVQADRFSAADALQERYGGVIVLKGNGTLVTSGGILALSDYGNPGMASGGMGDVLSGVVGAFLGQHLSPHYAAALGVCLHGAAADEAAAQGERGLLASDLMAPMRDLLG